MAYNKKQALSDNIKAIVKAFDIVWKGKERTDEDIECIKKFSGFGGIKAVLDLYVYPDKIWPKGNDLDSETNALLIVLGDVILRIMANEDMTRATQILESIKSSVLTGFYTPKTVVDAIGKAVDHVLKVHGVTAQSMLDPAAGSGNFLGICTNTKQTAVEKDYVTSLICAALNPQAEVFNAGFETMPKGEFDVIATNVPFADVKVHDMDFEKGDDTHKTARHNLHTYYFVKGLEQLEDGGIMAFVTSRGIADARSNEYLRRWLVENGNLLAAVRLPDNLFMDGSGVEVGSDLIVFQRDSHKSWQTLEEDLFVESIMKTFGETTIGPVNRLLCLPSQAVYTDWKFDTDRFGRNMVSKYYWRSDMSVLEAELTKRLSRDMERSFRHSAWIWGHDRKPKAQEQTSEPKGAASSDWRNERKERIEKMREPYNAIMACYTKLMTDERQHKIPFSEQRKQLNELYDAFVGVFGTLHSNEATLKAGKFPEYLLALNLERRNGKGGYEKSDVFVKPVAYREVDEAETLTPMEALAVCMNERGEVNMRYICSLCKEASEQNVIDALKGEIFWTTKTEDSTEWEWQVKAKAINGNVIAKRKHLEKITDGQPLQKVQDTIDALRKATPTPIPYLDIDIALGARWLPTKYFEQFVADTVETNRESMEIKYIPATDKFTVSNFWGKKQDQWTASKSWRDSRTANEVFSYAIEDCCPKITKRVYDNKKHDYVPRPDTEMMRIVQRKIDYIRRQFVDYMRSNKISEQDRKEIEQIYNEKFNCYHRADFDGSMQTFPGLHLENLGIQELYSSQKDAIWMLKQNNGGVCWHEVGAGKTIIEIVTGVEMHRLGLANKPLLIGMKANVGQIAETFRKIYPEGRLLYPGKEDFKAGQREKFFEQIKNNDWDLIIMSHNQFERIPMDPKVEEQIAARELQDVEDSLKALEQSHCSWKLDSRIKKGLQKRKDNLQAELYELRERIKTRKDTDCITFHDMGIDHILVDEYHEFKNLQFVTRHDRVPGIGGKTPVLKCYNLLTAIRDIQMQKGRDMCASFFSGTIITNALSELFVLFKYLRPQSMARAGVACFDAWAGNFTKKSTDYELSVTGELKNKERFRSYLNVPELAQYLREITDFRSAAMINLDIPKANVIFDQAAPSESQEEMLHRLVAFANSGNWDVLGLEERKQSEHLDKSLMLVATNLARDLSMDMRLLGEHQFADFANEPNSKAARCAKNIAERYRKFDKHRGTQFVFSDCSTYDATKWNIYSDIADRLVHDYNIPRNEIAFIHQHDTERKKQKLFDDLNAGRVRVVFGSTKKLGTGVNAQQRAVAVHHLDIPWRPSDLEQRNGRAVRKGNEVKIWGDNTVDVIIYGTERTLDAYKFNLLKNKALFISQINKGTIASRHIDEDEMDEQSGMNFAEYVALLSGNQDLLEKAKLDNKITMLEQEKLAHQRALRTAAVQIEDFEQRIGHGKETFVSTERLIAALSKAAQSEGRDKQLKDARETLGRTRANIAVWTNNIKACQAVLKTTWDNEQDLAELRRKREQLEDRIAASLDKKNQELQDSDED